MVCTSLLYKKKDVVMYKTILKTPNTGIFMSCNRIGYHILKSSAKNAHKVSRTLYKLAL